MFISVIICTYNRCESLRRTLETHCALVVPTGVEWEVLVMDNNSKDATKQICAEFNSKLPIRYLFEPKQGKSHALNLSVKEARGDLLLFTDDDVDIHPDWLALHADAAMRHPETVFFGGKIIPQWPKPPPRWLQEHMATSLRGMSVWFDLGPAERWISQRTDEMFLGANLSLRKDFLQKSGLTFRTDLGPTGGNPVRGEETFLLLQLIDQGLRGLYLPGAIVHHRNTADRMTESYVRHWYKGTGLAEVRDGKVGTAEPWLFGSPRYLWRRWLGHVGRYVSSRYTRPPSVWLAHEIKMAIVWGQICEFRNQTNRSAGRT